MAVSDTPWSQFSPADYSIDQWRRACVIDTGQGDPASKDRYKLPVREPSGTLNRNAVHAAAGGHGLTAVQGLSPDQKRAAAKKLVSLYGDLGEDPPPSLKAMAGSASSASSAGSAAAVSRSDDEYYARSWALDGIDILRAADGHGDGRTVEAYATPFDSPTEITDRHGHYHEVIDKTAFNRTLSHGIDRVGVYYHHGLTIHGTPSDLGSIPIGSPVEITPDRRGLRTVTRFNRSPMAESVLEAIRSGDIRGYSFRGRIIRSNPSTVPRARRGQIPTVRRLELGLTEYGPTPTPAYRDASIEAVRTVLQDLLTSTPRWDPDAGQATPDPGPGAVDSRDTHSARLKQLAFGRAVRDRGIR